MRAALVVTMIALATASPWQRRAKAQQADPLASALHALHCARDDESAAAALTAVERIPTDPFALPTEQGANGPVVRAAQIDALLLFLQRVQQQFPAQRRRVEQLVLSWNYCDLLNGREVWDLALEGGVQVRAPDPAKRVYRGFEAWGLRKGGSAERIVPRLFDDPSLAPGQREWFISDTVHGHCFPDPISGLRPFDDEAGESSVLGAHAAERDRIADLTAPEIDEVLALCPAPLPPPAPAAVAAPSPPPEPEPEPPPLVSAALIVANPSEGTSGVVAAPATTEGAGPKLGGNFYFSAPLKEGASSAGIRMTLVPAKNVFVRTGINERLDETGRLPTYSYGVGYNDWHSGTFSIELNHWGPIPVDRVNLKGAQLDFGYKVSLPEVLAEHFGLGVGLTVPFSRALSLSCGANLKVFGDWFVMSGVRWTPEEELYSWVYGFGVWSWKPYTFSLTYNNWGVNEAFDANFVKNGSVTLAWSWVL